MQTNNSQQELQGYITAQKWETEKSWPALQSLNNQLDKS